jgi:hypothetical protein
MAWLPCLPCRTWCNIIIIINIDENRNGNPQTLNNDFAAILHARTKAPSTKEDKCILARITKAKPVLQQAMTVQTLAAMHKQRSHGFAFGRRCLEAFFLTCSVKATIEGATSSQALHSGSMGVTHCSFPALIPDLGESASFHIWVSLVNLPLMHREGNEYTQQLIAKGFIFVHGDKTSVITDTSSSPQWRISEKFFGVLDKYKPELR